MLGESTNDMVAMHCVTFSRTVTESRMLDERNESPTPSVEAARCTSRSVGKRFRDRLTCRRCGWCSLFQFGNSKISLVLYHTPILDHCSVLHHPQGLHLTLQTIRF